MTRAMAGPFEAIASAAVCAAVSTPALTVARSGGAETWAEREGKANDPNSADVRAVLQAHVDKVNEDLARYESIKKFTVVPPMTVDSGLLTASLKVKRKVVGERLREVIDELYAEEAADVTGM